MLGRVAEVDGDYIATRFLAFAIPTDSIYISQSGRATRTTNDGGVRIKKDAQSILLGYARVWLPLLAVAGPVFQISSGGSVAAPLVVSVLFLGLFVLAYRSGRLTESEKARLRVLGTVTGLRLDPARLFPAMRDVKRELLGQLMVRAGIPITPDGILQVIDDIPIPAMPLVYGYARYSGDDQAWRECAAHVYARYELADV